MFRNLIRKTGSNGSGAGGIGKNVKISQRRLLDQSIRLKEILIRLTGKTDHHIRPDGGIRNAGANT